MFLELLVIFGVYSILAAIVLLAFWAVQIRFGKIEDLDSGNLLVRLFARKHVGEARRQPTAVTCVIHEQRVAKESGEISPVDYLDLWASTLRTTGKEPMHRFGTHKIVVGSSGNIMSPPWAATEEDSRVLDYFFLGSSLPLGRAFTRGLKSRGNA